MIKKTFFTSYLIIFLCIYSNFILAKDYELLDKIVVSVEKDVITQQEINKEILKKNSDTDLKNISKNEIKNQIIKYLIEKKLMEQYAKKIGLNPSVEEINLVMDNILKSNNITLEDLQKEISQNGGNINDFKDDLIHNLTIQKIKDREIMPYVNVSKYEIESFLKKKIDKSDTQYKLSHILIKHDNPKKDLIKIKISKIKNPEEFNSIAFQYSEGPNAEKYGDLGWNKKADLPNIFVDFLNKAKINDISEAIESSNGLHFLKLEDIQNIDKDNKVLVRQYKYQQILIKNNLISLDDEQEKKLTNVKNLINDGLDFSQAIKMYSDDQFSYNYEKLNWVNFDDLLPEFRSNLNIYPKQDLIGPFKTELGWHLIKVYGFREEDFTNEAEQQRAKIQIAREKTELRFKDWLDALVKNSNIKYFDVN